MTDSTADPLYTAKAQVAKVSGLHRRAVLEAGGEIDFGVHGPIKDFYRLESAEDLPLPVDYVVAAAGG